MDKNYWIEFLMKHYNINEKEAENSYNAIVNMANFCFNEYIKHIQTWKSVLSPLLKDEETLSEYLNKNK